MCYVVIDTSWKQGEEKLAGWSGTVLGEYRSLDSAKALTLQRMAYGDTGIVVVDSTSGGRAYPPESPAVRHAVVRRTPVY